VDGNLVSGRTFHDNGVYLGPWIQMLKAEREKRASILEAEGLRQVDL
jgi:protease I